MNSVPEPKRYYFNYDQFNSNLKRLKSTGSDMIIFVCAFTIVPENDTDNYLNHVFVTFDDLIDNIIYYNCKEMLLYLLRTVADYLRKEEEKNKSGKLWFENFGLLCCSAYENDKFTVIIYLFKRMD